MRTRYTAQKGSESGTGMAFRTRSPITEAVKDHPARPALGMGRGSTGPSTENTSRIEALQGRSLGLVAVRTSLLTANLAHITLHIPLAPSRAFYSPLGDCRYPLDPSQFLVYPGSTHSWFDLHGPVRFSLLGSRCEREKHQRCVGEPYTL